LPVRDNVVNISAIAGGPPVAITLQASSVSDPRIANAQFSTLNSQFTTNVLTPIVPVNEVLISGPVTSWQTTENGLNVEHLAGRNSSGRVLVFEWSPAHDWESSD